VNVESLAGTGPDGTVVEKDIREVAARGAPARESSSGEVPFTLRALTSMRRTIAVRMSQSAREAPHFFLAAEVDGSALLAWRDEHARRLEAESGVPLTITDLLVAATARALLAHPPLNAAWSPDGIRQWDGEPRARGGRGRWADGAGHSPRRPQALAGLMRERHDLVTRARPGSSSLGDLEGGTFTLSNLGAFGIDFFTSILNPPEAGILSIGTLRERAVVVDGRVVARPTAFVGLTIDHRVTDGAAGARFVQDFKARVERTYRGADPSRAGVGAGERTTVAKTLTERLGDFVAHTSSPRCHPRSSRRAKTCLLRPRVNSPAGKRNRWLTIWSDATTRHRRNRRWSGTARR
jgi:pyruvate dehydrogenase E2 component (dihydrolipoamide acetyltransferase)